VESLGRCDDLGETDDPVRGRLEKARVGCGECGSAGAKRSGRGAGTALHSLNLSNTNSGEERVRISSVVRWL
jgi:hypothetical protein